MDYGTSEILPIQSIYPGLDTTGTDVVEQVMPCSLAGVKPVSIRRPIVGLKKGLFLVPIKETRLVNRA